MGKMPDENPLDILSILYNRHKIWEYLPPCYLQYIV